MRETDGQGDPERDGPAAALGHELLQLSSLVFEYWHGFKQGHLTRDELQLWMRPVQRDFERLLERGAAADIERRSGSCADILAHRDALWTLANPGAVVGGMLESTPRSVSGPRTTLPKCGPGRGQRPSTTK